VAALSAGATLAAAFSLHGASTAGVGEFELSVPAVPPPARLGIAMPTPQPLQPAGPLYWSAPILHPVVARAQPTGDAAAIVALSARTPEATSNLVLVIGRKLEPDGALWLQVRLPMLPNNRTGWIPRSAVGGYSLVHTRLVVDLGRLEATLLRDGRPIFRARVGAGKPSSPTPTGDFYIRDRLTSFHNAFYGPLAFGTSARSAVLTDWPGGGFVGIHGTNRPELIPGFVSHGCIRMRNADIIRLGQLMPAGTPLTIL
jgi:lipoprotein-anchoring transpeptidase ErfK/SrfK